MLLHYGKKQVELKIPQGVPYKVLSGQSHPPLENPAQSIMEALQNPIGTARLSETLNAGESVCIIANDSTRISRSDIFLPLLIDEILLAGVEKKDIFIVFANGSHRPLSKPEMTELVGERVASEFKMYNHDCDDRDNLLNLGKTSRGTPVHINKKVAQADRRILTGSVLHHYFAGYGGGRKALMPGVAGRETIQKNHSLLLEKDSVGGKLEGNPLHEDLLEAALKVGGDFLLNTVLNEKKELLGVFAGDLVKAHLQACSMVDQVNGIAIDRLADIVIVSCGGYPKDINLYQAHKSLDNGIAALKPNGRLIFLASCPEGIGSEKYELWARKRNSLEQLEKELRQDFVLGGHKAFTVLRLLKHKEVYLISDLPGETSSLHGFIPARSLDEAINSVYRDSRNLFTYILPQGSTTVPRYAGR